MVIEQEGSNTALKKFSPTDENGDNAKLVPLENGQEVEQTANYFPAVAAFS